VALTDDFSEFESKFEAILKRLEGLHDDLGDLAQSRVTLDEIVDDFTKAQNLLADIKIGILEATIPATAAPVPSASVPRTPTGEPRRPAASASGEKRGFYDMLTEVGRAMIRTQRDLDEQSLDYTRQSGQRVGMASSFRVPKVNASFRFALETTQGKELNLVFYESTDQTKNVIQQNIEVEIVAVPPTPEFRAAAETAWPRFRLLTDPDEREPYIEKLRLELRSDPASIDRTLLLRLQRGTADPDGGEIVLAALSRRKGTGAATTTVTGAWLLRRASADGDLSAPEALLDNRELRPGDRQDGFRSLLDNMAELSEQQALLLAPPAG